MIRQQNSRRHLRQNDQQRCLTQWLRMIAVINHNQASAITKKEGGKVVTGHIFGQGGGGCVNDTHNPINLKHLIRRSFQDSP